MINSPPCQWYESPEVPACGKPSEAVVKVKTKITQARVNLCRTHKALHDQNFARARNSR